MIDPLLSLAYSMHANKGVYALLLGSGVSRTAAIPTGWEIILDLVEKVAAMHKEECEPDPVAWFTKKYGKDPDYSELVAEVAKSPNERQQLLRSYFEPSDDEREQGLKVPTAAHTAIARLVSRGYIRLIMTTNFDRLIERAIEAEGITPVVLSTPDAIQGALPLAHQQCCIIKLHGDYLDSRIKNTFAELERYDRRVSVFLNRILDEFGVIICGWSAQWDPALRSAIERCKSRRFTTYFAARGELSDHARRLLSLRGGVQLPISGADDFFAELTEKIEALESFEQPHPLSVSAAAATTKRLLSEPKHLIRLQDLIQGETERTYEGLQPVFEALLRDGEDHRKLESAVSQFQSHLRVLQSIAIWTAYWGNERQLRALAEIPSRLISIPAVGQSGEQLNDALRSIPSIMAVYAMGLAATAAHNVDAMAAILAKPVVYDQKHRLPYIACITWSQIDAWFRYLHANKHVRFPASEWLFRDCRELLRPLIPDDNEYDLIFDRFEILRSLVVGDFHYKGKYPDEEKYIHGQPGRFVLKTNGYLTSGEHALLQELRNDKQLAEALINTGLFSKDIAVFQKAVDKFKGAVLEMSHRALYG